MSVSHASHPIISIILLKLNLSLHYSNYKSTVTVNWERERETIIAAAEEKRERENMEQQPAEKRSCTKRQQLYCIIYTKNFKYGRRECVPYG